MDKSILKNFAIDARKNLQDQIEDKIKTFFVEEKFDKEQRGDVFVLLNNNHTLTLTKNENDKRELLIKRVEDLGLNKVIEEAAYTWFNRIVAIRYMEINNYLPLTKNNESLDIRIFSSRNNEVDPEILKYSNLTNSYLDLNINLEYLDSLSNDNKKFEYILQAVVDKLKKVIPQVFGGITDYIDILIPSNLLNDGSFVHSVVKDIPTNNFTKVEIIGWLYQYYNQTEKDRVISPKNKNVYKKDEIAYATQLFTPDWIVKYMVENSLGRYWIENSGIDYKDLMSNWKYFIKDNLDIKGKTISPEEITFIDPCSGSGHILVYAFEVFYQIYLSAGYNKKDIPELILKNNIYGLDIDDRAGQLSVLALLLKSREYDKDIFNKEIVSNLNILSLQESQNVNVNSLEMLPDNEKKTAEYLKEIFKDAKEIGSLLILEDKDYEELKTILSNKFILEYFDLDKSLSPLMKQAKILSSKYSIVVTNPPYINLRKMSEKVKQYISSRFSFSKHDMFSAFIHRNMFLCKEGGFLSLMTPNVWMYLSSYSKLRKHVVNNSNISTFVDLKKGSFFSEATVDIVAFTIKLSNDLNIKSTFIKLSSFNNHMEDQKIGFLETINNSTSKNKYNILLKDLKKLPDLPFAYWITEKESDLFKQESFEKRAFFRQGMATSNNKKFLRFWYEVSLKKSSYNSEGLEIAREGKKKWFSYNKGGDFRKWYGNHEYVVNWENDGKELKEYTSKLSQGMNVRLKSREYYFKESLSWSKISSGQIAFRYYPQGFIFDVAGCSIFNAENLKLYLLGLSNTKVSHRILEYISPTLNFELEHIKSIPIIIYEDNKDEINDLVQQNIDLSKDGWDSFETSWDFKMHPLISEINKFHYGKKGGNEYLLSDVYNHLKTSWNMMFDKLKENEERLNEIFIKIYGLEDELTAEVSDRDITIAKVFDHKDDIYEEIKGNRYIQTREDLVKSLISYAVGCMFGRYSLDKEGLAYAGGDFNLDMYKTFKADKDNIIPIIDDEYFNDDIVGRLKEFIITVYGKETLNENIQYIADSLGKRDNETDEDTIRRYFINNFYKDHVKTYKKKPIYWLFDSGKQDGFKALIYMHRYDKGTVSKVRLDYLHRMQKVYERELRDIEEKLDNDLSSREKRQLESIQKKINDKIQELNAYDEKIGHIASQAISIDLDDGVTENYSKFKEVLAKI